MTLKGKALRKAIAADARRRQGERVLDAVFPNLGIEATFKKRLTKLIREMHDSFLYWLQKAYRNNPPVMAQDATAAQAMEKAIKELIKRWQKRFDWAAPRLADWFLQSIATRSDKALAHILRKGGISVRFKMTKAQKEIIGASVQESVALIKSIPQQYYTKIVPLVMNSVREGGQLHILTKQLQKQFKSTANRAALIARDQNNKATAALQRARQTELGIKEAIWLHSRGGRVPRPTHVANSGKRYNIQTGWYDPHEKVFCWPGTLINCRCVTKSIIPGFS